MSIQSYFHARVNRLRTQSRTSDVISPEPARQLYRYLRDELGLQVDPRNNTKHNRLIGDRYYVTFSPKNTEVHMLIQRIK